MRGFWANFKHCAPNFIIWFQGCNAFAFIGCALWTSSAVVLALTLIFDGLLLFGTLKKKTLLLIIGLALNVLAIIGLIVVGIFFIRFTVFDPGYYALCLAFFITVALKIWAFVIVVGIVLELKSQEKESEEVKSEENNSETPMKPLWIIYPTSYQDSKAQLG